MVKTLLSSLSIAVVGLVGSVSSVSAFAHSPDFPNDCTICTDPLANGTTTLGCGHEFHQGCIDSWLAEQASRGLEPTCPNCRQPIGPVAPPPAVLPPPPPPAVVPAQDPRPLTQAEWDYYYDGGERPASLNPW